MKLAIFLIAVLLAPVSESQVVLDREGLKQITFSATPAWRLSLHDHGGAKISYGSTIGCPTKAQVFDFDEIVERLSGGGAEDSSARHSELVGLLYEGELKYRGGLYISESEAGAIFEKAALRLDRRFPTYRALEHQLKVNPPFGTNSPSDLALKKLQEKSEPASQSSVEFASPEEVLLLEEEAPEEIANSFTAPELNTRGEVSRQEDDVPSERRRTWTLWTACGLVLLALAFLLRATSRKS